MGLCGAFDNRDFPQWIYAPAGEAGAAKPTFRGSTATPALAVGAPIRANRAKNPLNPG
jgi:hypothetical protein